MKQKMIAGMMALVLIGTMAYPVHARETEITATVTSTYELTIPAATTITYNSTSTQLNGDVTVKGNVLPNQIVTVTADAGAFHNDEQNADLPYTLVDASTNQKFTTATWTEAQMRERLKTVTLNVNITEDDWKSAEAGTYSGTITFKAELSTTNP